MSDQTDQAKELEVIKQRIVEISAAYLVMFTEKEELKKENRELRADRDYWRQLFDQTGGKG